jgi:hypothetical protein
MKAVKAVNLVHVHADALTHAALAGGQGQILEPGRDDAAAVPRLFEDLEAQLWGGPLTPAEAEDLVAGADVNEVLHPVLGIELDAG